MGARTVVCFVDNQEGSYYVYDHEGSDPAMMARVLRATLKLAWPLPRFEPSQFAASYCAASIQEMLESHRRCGGEFRNALGHGVRLTRHWADHGDLNNYYVVFMECGRLHVRCTSRDSGSGAVVIERTRFLGTIKSFLEWGDAQGAAKMAVAQGERRRSPGG